MSNTEYYLLTISRNEFNAARDLCVMTRSPTLEHMEEKTAEYVAETAETLNMMQQMYGHNPTIEIPTLHVTSVFFDDLNARVNIVITEEGGDESLRADRKADARESVEFMRNFS